MNALFFKNKQRHSLVKLVVAQSLPAFNLKFCFPGVFYLLFNA